MSKASSQYLVERLVASCDNDVTTAAHKMRVSVATIARWRTGQSRPQPTLERRLMSLTHDTHPDHDDLFSRNLLTASDVRLNRIEAHVLDALSEIREVFHSHSHFSSQQDCLDFIASIFFAHISSIESGGSGISADIVSGFSNAAEALSVFVQKAYDENLSDDQKKSLDERFRTVNLTDNDYAFAETIISKIEKTRDAIREAHSRGRDDILNAIFSRFICGSFVDEKEMGQYLTPPEVVDLMTRYGLSCLSTEMRNALTNPNALSSSGIILDPSCGVGSFLGSAVHILSDRARTLFDAEGFEKWKNQLLSDHIVGFEKSMRMAHLAITNLFLFGAGTARVHRVNSLIKSDLTTSSIDGQCWLILTNPPFGAEFSGDEILNYKITRNGAKNYFSADSEILFIERYIDWLAPGGVLVSVVPDNLLTGQGIYAQAREYIRNHCQIMSIVSLPSVTFAAAGTSTKTSILTIRKMATASNQTSKTYFGVCSAVGFDVVTRGGYRRRRPLPDNDLSTIASDLSGGSPPELGRWGTLTTEDRRWDAIYHAHPSLTDGIGTEDGESSSPLVKDVANLVDERNSPKRLFKKTFPYIEISDIDPKTGWVHSKSLPVEKAPSRARKVVRAGDVLVSTVRPERGAVGVVPQHLDGAICSTGIGVLRPFQINAHLLRRLLISKFVISQMERHNVGIAYPAISEQDLLSFGLPIPWAQMEKLAELGELVEEALNRASASLTKLDEELNEIGPELSR